jgi:hypothetical protein
LFENQASNRLFEINSQFFREVLHRIFNRQGQASAQGAKRAFFEGVNQVVPKLAIDFVIATLGFLQQFLAACGSDPAGKTFATTLMGSERKQVL